MDMLLLTLFLADKEDQPIDSTLQNQVTLTFNTVCRRQGFCEKEKVRIWVILKCCKVDLVV